MSGDEPGELPFAGEPADTKEAIMRATYRALRRHGYADLSIGNIAQEAGLSKSAFYNHYDGKDDLLLSFLEFMLGNFERVLVFDETDDPLADLRTAMTVAAMGNPLGNVEEGPLPPRDPEDVPRESPTGAFIEMRAHAIHDPQYRQRYTGIDRVIRSHLAGIIRRGVDDGTFRQVDPERAADLLLSLFMGVMLRRTTADSVDNEAVRAELDDLVDRYLLAAD